MSIDVPSNRPDAHFLSAITAPLLEWYGKGARPLPWRENTDPYRVWLSEIMLQQTRVDTVIPYYHRFLAALPDIPALAAAPEELLLKLWEGLGYYSRVRNLQKAAQLICRDYGGVFPAEHSQIAALPGIGAYTAGAVASIAFSKPTPAVDGNVLRVLARLTEDYRDISAPALKAEYTRILANVYPADRPGDFTQSLMELGATICLPKSEPHCGRCPLGHLCLARQSHSVCALPVKSPKAPRKTEDKTVFLLYRGDELALVKRAQSGLLGGMWALPDCPGHLTKAQARQWLRDQGVTVSALSKAPGKKHIFTHLEWHMTCYRAETAQKSADFFWADQTALAGRLALPTAYKKCLE